MAAKKKSPKRSPGRRITTKHGPALIRCDGGYRINLVYNGKRYRRKFQTIKAGIEYLDELYKPDQASKDKEDIRGHIRDYLRWSEVDAKKGASWISSLQFILGHFADFLTSQSVTSSRGITTDHFRAYRAYWLSYNKHRSENTWEKYRQGIASWLNWLNKRDPKVRNVAGGAEFKRRIHQNPPETLEQDEIESILKYFDSQDAGRRYPIGTAIRILLYTGIRLGEFVALKWADVDLRGRTLRCGTKTKQTRTVPVAEKLLPYLRSLPRDTVYVFDDGHGNYLYHRKRYYQELQKACAVMGIKRHSIQSLRHTFVRYLLEAGTPINEVAKIVGHDDIRTTMRYAAHYSISRAKDAVNTLPY